MTSRAADPQYWCENWENNTIGWHRPHVNYWLHANLKILTGGREKVKIFVPLCGKSVDIKWLSDMGHEVVGVEVSPKACREFFEDLSIAYTTSPITGCDGTVYKSKDGKIKIYCCSIFDFTSKLEGQFDAIWDRGSLVALPPDLTEAYQASMELLMKPGCQYILELVDYILPGKTGPPYRILPETLQKYIGTNCNIEVLGKFPSPEDMEKLKSESFDVEMIRITKK